MGALEVFAVLGVISLVTTIGVLIIKNRYKNKIQPHKVYLEERDKKNKKKHEK